MDSRTLDRRITIQSKSVTQDADYGTEVETWAAITNGERIPANVQGVLPSKSEATRNGLRLKTQPTRIRIRYRSDVTAEMRIIIHGDTETTCEIVSGPVELGRRDGLEMMVEHYSS